MEHVRNNSYTGNIDEENNSVKPLQQEKLSYQFHENNIKPNERTKICRLCAQLIRDGTATNIYDTFDLAHKINSTLPIILKPNDGLPSFICNDCENKFNTFHRFVCEVVKADKKLKTKEDSSNDPVSKTIEEIFGSDSDDESKDIKLPQKVAFKRLSSDSEDSKRLKTEATPPDSNIDNKQYICKTCGSHFQEYSTLLRHYKIQHGGLNLPCPQVDCIMTVNNEKQLREHIQESHGVPVICHKCGKIFLNQEALLKHQRNKHSAKVCSLCWTSFDTEIGFEAHMLEHESNQHQCTYCHKVYQTSRGLKRHTITHHGHGVTLRMDDVVTVEDT